MSICIAHYANTPLQLPDALRPLWVKRPGDLDLWPFDLESGFRITCDVGYLCANFSLPRPPCSRLRPDVRDRQASSDVRRASSLNASALGGGGIIIMPKSQLAWYAKTPRDQMLSRRFLLKAAGPWRGTWQLFAPRLTLTLISPCRVLTVWRRWQPLAKRRNTPLYSLTITSSRSRSRLWVLSMSRTLLFCTAWVGEFRSWAGRTESLNFCFNAFQSPSSALTRCFCMTVFCLPTTRISADPVFNFLHWFFPSSGIYPPRQK